MQPHAETNLQISTAQLQTASQATHSVLSAAQRLQLQAELLGRKRFGEAATALAQELASSLKGDHPHIVLAHDELPRRVVNRALSWIHVRLQAGRA